MIPITDFTVRNKTSIMIAGILLLASILTSCQSLSITDKRAVWEYKTIIGSSREGNDEASLNKLGSEGWELVAIELKTEGGILPAYIFKRKKD